MPRLAAVLAALLLSGVAHGWDANAHKVIGTIAYRHLTPRARAWCDGLLATMPEGYRTFLDASPYPDYLKHGAPKGMPEVRRSRKYDRWHFVDYPVRDGQVSTVPYDRSVEGSGDDVEYGLVESVRSMTTGLAETRGFYLAMVLHLAGDAHQPLHCAERDGDEGGNAVPVAGGHGARNLHALWDDAITARFHLRTKRQRSDERIREVASEIERDCPLSDPSMSRDARDLDARHWAEESYALAVTSAYDGIEAGRTPSGAYVERLARVSERRVALAGYRLANLLNLLAPKG